MARSLPTLVPVDVNLSSHWSWLAPIAVPDLIRVGSANDGGYVVPQRLVTGAAALVSMGLGQNWQFELDVKALNPAIRVQVYDHTVSARMFARDFYADLAGLLTGDASLDRVRRRRQRLHSYRTFFGAEATHFCERIHDRSGVGSVDIATVFERAGAGPAFVKMDIEGAEYRVLEDVMAHADRILGLAVEFHDTGPLRQVFERTVALVTQRFDIVHVHANNFVPPYRDGFPEALEITFARRDLVHGAERRVTLPLPEFDHPNDPKASDYRLTFA